MASSPANADAAALGAPDAVAADPDAQRKTEQGLGRTHVESFVVSLASTGLLSLQNLLVLLLIDRRELGLLGIASGIGSLALIAQYFGIGASTLKEVSVAQSRRRAGELMVAGITLRMALTLPFAAALVALSGWIAGTVYDQPELRTPLMWFAAILLLYGITDVCSYTIQGLHAWRRFFIVKLTGAALHPPIVLGATAVWGLDGYFGGLAAAATGGAVIAVVGVLSLFGWRVKAPSRARLRIDMRTMVPLGFYAHVAKILQVLGLQAPILIAGYHYSAELTGDLKFALTIGAALLALSGAVNSVNISVFSRRFASSGADLRRDVRRQIGLYATLTGGLAAMVALLAPEIVDVVGRGRYASAVPASVLAIAATALFGLIGVVVSTLHIPAGNHRQFVGLYLIPTVATSLAAVAVARTGGSIDLMGAGLLAGTSLGVAVAYADLARRGLLPPSAWGILLTAPALLALPAVELADGARFALAGMAAVALVILTPRASRARV